MNRLKKKSPHMKKEKLSLQRIVKDWKKYKWLYLFFALPVVLYYTVFKYILYTESRSLSGIIK